MGSCLTMQCIRPQEASAVPCSLLPSGLNVRLMQARISMGQTACTHLQDVNVRGHLHCCQPTQKTAMPIWRGLTGWRWTICTTGKQNSMANILLWAGLYHSKSISAQHGRGFCCSWCVMGKLVRQVGWIVKAGLSLTWACASILKRTSLLLPFLLVQQKSNVAELKIQILGQIGTAWYMHQAALQDQRNTAFTHCDSSSIVLTTESSEFNLTLPLPARWPVILWRKP